MKAYWTRECIESLGRDAYNDVRQLYKGRGFRIHDNYGIFDAHFDNKYLHLDADGDFVWCLHMSGDYKLYESFYDHIVDISVRPPKAVVKAEATEAATAFVAAKTYWAKIYVAGPIEVAKQICRAVVKEKGLCVTVDPTVYIYTGGEEQGYVVGIINYPRFPAAADVIRKTAEELAKKLVAETYQHSCTIMYPDDTLYYSTRDYKDVK